MRLIFLHFLLLAVLSNSWTELIEHYTQNGATIQGIELFSSRQNPGQRGLKASRNIRRGEEFIKIPEKLGFICERGRCNPKMVTELKQHEKGQSRISPWLNMVPSWKNIKATFPHFQEDLIQDFSHIFTGRELGIMYKIRTVDKYVLYARMLMTSRGFDLGAATVDLKNMKTGTRDVAMINMGVVDMINHSPNANSGYYITNGIFTVVATRNIRKGQEILNSYGAKDNKAFVMTYGFLDENNSRRMTQHISKRKCESMEGAIEKWRHENRAKVFIGLANELCFRYFNKQDL